MTAGTKGRKSWKVATEATAEDPYRELVKAILHRAVEDAQGRCIYPGSRTPDQIETEARAWLADGREFVELVELMGCDADPILRRVQQILRTEKRHRHPWGGR